MFERNPVLKNWMGKIGATTKSEISSLASLTTEQGTQVLRTYLYGSALLFVVTSVLFTQLSKELGAALFGAAFFVFYIAASLDAWLRRRIHIAKSFLEDAKGQARAALFGIVGVASVVFVGGVVLHNYYPFPWIELAKVVGFLLVFGSGVLLVGIAIGNSISLGLVFAPGWFALAYLWLIVWVSKTILKIGGKGLANMLEIYGIVVSIYLFTVGIPTVRNFFHIPLLCE
jgi:hypothetical protein